MIIKIFKNWLSRIKPRYFLALDSSLYDAKKVPHYRFKAFGEHSFPTFNYDDIIKNKHIIYSINPYDLLDIAVSAQMDFKKKQTFNISEFLRGNRYKLCNFNSEITVTGEEICANPALLEKISQVELCKIAYNTGFIEGRNLSKQITIEAEKKYSKSQITQLKVVQKVF